MEPASKVFVNNLSPNDILVVDGPAIVHVNYEKGKIVLATQAGDDVIIAHVKGPDFRELKEKHGDDAAAIAAEAKHGSPDEQ